MVCEDVLKIKNLPKELTDAEKEDFVKHFGATKVKVITPKSTQKSVVFARFESKEIAREVLFRLHQAYVLKSRLCVEYAAHDIGLPKIKKIEETNTNSKENLKTFITKLHSFNQSVGFQQPPPPHLKYNYPKANYMTINNIGHALATVPTFYKQVLHLMNRMNLPPPFAVPRQQQKVQQQQKVPESSSESELESDEEAKTSEIIPQKRAMKQKKSVKRPKFIKATAGQPTKPTKTGEMFEKTELTTTKKIEVKVTGAALENPQADKADSVGVIASSYVEEPEKDELASNQIPEKDLAVLPVFKNYHPGAPSCRLYIKNIAKNVELKDLEHIYSRYKTDEAATSFDIKLMQEGRMKGQAFVTLDSVEAAQKALKETNAFILKNKPLVVVFARSVTNKKT